MVNTQIEKLAPNLPTGIHQLEQAAGYRYYFSTDSVACYNSFVLKPGKSREAFAVWTPIGLVHPTVLPFGQKNSGSEAQGPYRQASRFLRNVANYVDDWLGYENSIEDLLGSFRKFLEVCEAANITLNTSKTKIGYASAQFFGFTVDKSGTRLADKHRVPLKQWFPLRTSPSSGE
jgi:hypothetical protein